MAVLENCEPKRVFHYFEEICKIPHGSGNTKQISDYLVQFAKDHDLKYVQDEMNNVVIYKPGTAGYENAPVVIIQGHMDMVCEKRPDVEHDFTKDGLNLSVEGDYVSANGTTLGGDDGIAVAYGLALLESDTIAHPPLEVFITVDEEIKLIELSGLRTNILHDHVTAALITPKKEGITQNMESITMRGLMIPELYDNISFFVPIVRDVIETADKDKMVYARAYVEDDSQFKLRKNYSLSGGDIVMVDRGRAISLTIQTEPFQELTEVEILPFVTAPFVNKHKLKAKTIANTKYSKLVEEKIILESSFTDRIAGAVEEMDKGLMASFELGLDAFEKIEELEVRNG